jgi:ATP-dependent helicase/nuclease subunit B
MLSKDELFGRLAQGHAAGITVVTPNRRLSHALMLEFDDFQGAKGLTVWEAPDILPLGAFVERLWEEALYSERGGELPLLLSGAQEEALWQEILEHSGLLIVPQAAAQCRDAWRLAHAWRIRPGGAGEDATAFREWSDKYAARTLGQVDAARLPDLGFLTKKPNLLVAYCFDIIPPQTREFFARFEHAECKPEPVAGACLKASFASSGEELEHAARWARARLEEGRARIGVVVPDLARRRKEVVRVFSRVMQPGYNLPGSANTAMPFNLSLGQPLADYALVDVAFLIIQFSSSALQFNDVSRLLRSPFLGGAESEMAQRARLDVYLRRRLGATVSLRGLIASIEHCPLLRSSLEKLLSEEKRDRQLPPSEWARHFSALLEAAGFPGERTLDSEEFQVRAKWHEALGELARLERVAKEWSFGEALAHLRRLCEQALFQPETPEAPVQVLGILESAGLTFDCLWVSGLTDEAWPLDARPNPFLPIAAQKAAGVPEAAAETSLELDRRITEGWQRAAAEVIFSFPTKLEDRDLSPSPLIAAIAEGRLDIPAYPRLRDLLFKNRKMISLEDPKGPPVPPGAVRGGTRVLADQAACPFRAFARWRLNAEELEEPVPGLDARDRGSLAHALMKLLWDELKGSRALREDLEPAIRRAAEAAVKEAGLEGRLAELERQRLAKLAREWLNVEKARKDFEVLFTEEKRDLKVGELTFTSRIDRMDRLLTGPEAGTHVLIDYKTGYASPKHWEPPRPDDPQLPLYASASQEELAAVAFAKLKTGELKFMGYSRAEKLLPNVQVYRNWPGLLALWKKEAEALGASFAAGEANVDPKNDLKTCARCDLHTLCRVFENLNVLQESEEGEA